MQLEEHFVSSGGNCLALLLLLLLLLPRNLPNNLRNFCWLYKNHVIKSGRQFIARLAGSNWPTHSPGNRCKSVAAWRRFGLRATCWVYHTKSKQKTKKKRNEQKNRRSNLYVAFAAEMAQESEAAAAERARNWRAQLESKRSQTRTRALSLSLSVSFDRLIGWQTWIAQNVCRPASASVAASAAAAAPPSLSRSQLACCRCCCCWNWFPLGEKKKQATDLAILKIQQLHTQTLEQTRTHTRTHPNKPLCANVISKTKARRGNRDAQEELQKKERWHKRQATTRSYAVNVCKYCEKNIVYKKEFF